MDLNIRIAPNQNLKYDGGNEIVLYDKFWNKLKTIIIDPSKFFLTKGSHKIKIDCNFEGSKNASLKLELKTIHLRFEVRRLKSEEHTIRSSVSRLLTPKAKGTKMHSFNYF